MLGNWIKQTTTTTGPGPLTLAAVAGYPRFVDAIPDIGRLFFYTILNADGTPVENGFGRLTDATTLSRVKILATYSGGVYANTNASAVNLAAGTYTVICAGNESSHAMAIPNTNAVLAGSNTNYVSGTRFIVTADRSRNTGTATFGAFTFYIPFWLQCVADVVSLAVNVTTASAGCIGNLALYEVSDKGGPGLKLFETGSLDLSVTGMVTGSVTARRLVPGWYYTGIAVSGSAVVRGFGTGGFDSITAGNPVGTIGGGFGNYCFSENRSGIVLPATPAPNDFIATNATIFVGVR